MASTYKVTRKFRCWKRHTCVGGSVLGVPRWATAALGGMLVFRGAALAMDANPFEDEYDCDKQED